MGPLIRIATHECLRGKGKLTFLQVLPLHKQTCKLPKAIDKVLADETNFYLTYVQRTESEQSLLHS